MPFGCLLGDFSRHFRGLWGFAGCHSLSSENLYFQVLEFPDRHLCVHFSRSGFQGVFFNVLLYGFCDLGSPLGSLLAPFGPLFFGELAIQFRIGEKVASGVAKESFLGALGHHLGGFLMIF